MPMASIGAQLRQARDDIAVVRVEINNTLNRLRQSDDPALAAAATEIQIAIAANLAQLDQLCARLM